MENLNNVPSTGTFGGSVSTINSNFDLVVNAINSLEYQTTRSKGILNYGQNPATVFPNAVAGDWCMILSEGNVFPATIKTFNGSTWSGSGTWNPEGVDLTQYAQKSEMTTAIANSLAQATARMGYGECTVSGTSLAVSIPNFILPTSGGTIHIKMSAAGTGASTLSINGTTAKTLWYNGAAVSSQNTWEANEIISVFYDGTRFMASNSQGFNKLNVDTSESDLDINDDSNNTLARFSDGHVKTKNFDSRDLKAFVGDADSTDLDFADEGDNVIMRVANGHVRTKNFDSSKVSQNGGIINSLTSNNNAKAISSMTDPLLDNIASAYYYQKGGANKDFDYGKKVCIITAGQSNARGATRDPMPSALSSALPIQNCHFVENLTYEQSSYNAAPFEDFYAFGYSHSGRYLPDRWGFDAQLYYDIAVRDSQEFYVIKTAQGDTSIDPNGFGNGHWSADYEKITSGIKLIREFEKNIKVHVNNYGLAFDIRAFVWHQGEGDRSTSSGEEYYDNLKNVFAYIRGVVGNNQLPIIIGGISHLSSQWTQAVEDTQLRIYNEDPNVYYIDMSGAPLHSYDTYHFSQASCVYLGHKVHDILVELGIVLGSKINPTRPW